jgi:hypothetical protein
LFLKNGLKGKGKREIPKLKSLFLKKYPISLQPPVIYKDPGKGVTYISINRGV